MAEYPRKSNIWPLKTQHKISPNTNPATNARPEPGIREAISERAPGLMTSRWQANKNWNTWEFETWKTQWRRLSLPVYYAPQVYNPYIARGWWQPSGNRTCGKPKKLPILRLRESQNRWTMGSRIKTGKRYSQEDDGIFKPLVLKLIKNWFISVSIFFLYVWINRINVWP